MKTPHLGTLLWAIVLILVALVLYHFLFKGR